ncbi:unnamed protein product [Heligmosomoides polygyrus]|uniref:Retrotrans_gag domain-containing protein n=1 Tax=Heligmosomoides polygyrus TaxID=6339 RepID=A0A183FFQ7_HELPZ|nr:unnamed protein product [Heligmosomoides polygyrus]
MFTDFLTLRKVVDEADKRLIFHREVGANNYELLESLLQGKELEATTLHELKETMEKHYQPKKLLLAERFEMMTRTKKVGQTLQDFFAEVQRAANECAFEKVTDVRDTMATMVFTGGLTSVNTRKRLLEKEDLTSKEALKIAEAFECVGLNAPHLKEGPARMGVSEVWPKKPTSGKNFPRVNNRERMKPGALKAAKGEPDKAVGGLKNQSIVCRACGQRGT